MNFVLPLRPSRAVKASKTPKALRTTKTLQPPPESPRRRPSLATRAGVVKRRSSVVTTFNAPSMSFFEAMFGDDFPDAFANGDGRSCKSRKTLLDLPTEILEIVCRSLSKMDIKRLRFTCRDLAEGVDLRIQRVFISPNRANLDCLNYILNHPKYRLRVQEIVWDDTRLEEYRTFKHFHEALNSDSQRARATLETHLQTFIQSGTDNDADYEPISVEDCIQEDGRLTELGKAIVLSSDDRTSRDIIASNAATMSVDASYSLYQKLYQDEKEIVKRGWDVNGLQRALAQLPNLKRITLTNKVWRPRKHLPTYDTPFFRALPHGFQMPSLSPYISVDSYPQPRLQWSNGLDGLHEETARTIEQQSSEQHLPVRWRGYSIIMSSLATNSVPHLEEFVMDIGNEAEGLPLQLFAAPNVDYNNTIRALSTTQLKKLQLSLVDHSTLVHLDLLSNLIVAVPYLEHLDLTWNASPQPRFPFGAGFPNHTYHRLKSIALRCAKIDGGWLLNLIKRLTNLETMTLDRIQIVPPHELWIGREAFFTRLRDHYVTINQRGPNFTWIECPCFPREGSNLWQSLDDELDAFLYDGAESPWQEDNIDVIIEHQSAFKPGFGWLIDVRDPTFREKRKNRTII